MGGPISGFGSNLTPDYTKETGQVQIRKGISENPSQNEGAILAEDSLDIPFERMTATDPQEAEMNRPALPPLYRHRMAEEKETAQVHDYYQRLRDRLSPSLQAKLNMEGEKDPADRDPEIIALDASLKFEAGLLVFADALVNTGEPIESTRKRTERFRSLQETIEHHLNEFEGTVSGSLDKYLETLSRNDPAFEHLAEISNEIKEAISFLKQSEKQTDSNA